MPETTSNDQWIWGLDKKICAMTKELCSKNHIVEVAPFIKEIKEEKKKEEDNHDFHPSSDTIVVEGNIHYHLEIEAILAAM